MPTKDEVLGRLCESEDLSLYLSLLAIQRETRPHKLASLASDISLEISNSEPLPQIPEGLDLANLELCLKAHQLIISTLLHHLQKVKGHIAHWKNLLDSHFRFFLEAGPLHWLSLSRQVFAPAGSDTKLPLSSRVRATQRRQLVDKIQRLQQLESTSVEQVAILYEKSSQLKKISQVEQSFGPCVAASVALYGFMFDKAYEEEVETAEDLLNLLVMILHEVVAFKKRVNEVLSPLKKPSHFRRNWHWYTLGAVATTVLATKIYRNRDALSQWASETGLAMYNFFTEHVTMPIMRIYSHVFQTFRDRAVGTSIQQLDASKETLSRMLLDFARTHPDPSFSQRQIETLARQGDIAYVMKNYEAQIQKPLKGLMAGDLVQALLIQIQKLKIDTEGAMVSLDQLLQANEINFELLAIVPGLLIGFPLVSSVYNFIFYRQVPLSQQLSARHLRLLVRMVDSLLINCYHQHHLTLSQTGFLLLHTEMMLNEGKLVLHRDDFELLVEDVEEIRDMSLTVVQKKLIVDRMFKTHRFLGGF
eukprot:TRINITY_DN8725_c0_g2_i6.p1 TRINITY_DN8725_c0_g2~~TRINITY_DN8725_c0_g2_i6.p1  ORF type:complete len:532 (+),score=127.61 TRINITY_DN8725_c0_g2_i6:55-1650(+)